MSVSPARPAAIEARRGTSTSGAIGVSRGWMYLAVAFIAVAASASGLFNEFVFDDIAIIQDNARVHSLSNLPEILRSSYWPPPYAQELYRPVASLLHAMQYVFGSGEPMVFRIVSYALYVICACAVLKLAFRILPEWSAFAVAALFAAHPLHVEAVALGVNQGEILITIAAVLSVLVYLDARRAGALGVRDWGALCAMYAIAILTKENGFVIPALLISTEVFLVDEPGLVARLRKQVPGYVVLALVGGAVLAIRAALLSGNIGGAVPAEALTGLNAGERLLTMLQVVPMWARLFAWPMHLQMDYSPDEIVAYSRFGAAEISGVVLIVVAVVAVFVARRRAPVVTFGLTWCALGLLPVSNVIVPSGIMLAERTLFLPSVGFLFAVVASVDLVVASVHAHQAAVRRAFSSLCIVLVTFSVLRSEDRHKVWKNSETLWRAAAVEAPRSKRVKRARAEAIADMTRALEREADASPEPWRGRLQLARVLQQLGADSAALVQLRESLRKQPEQAEVQLELVAALLTRGQYAEAVQIAGSVHASADTAFVFQRLKQLGDSAASTNAPPGTVRVQIADEFSRLRGVTKN